MRATFWWGHRITWAELLLVLTAALLVLGACSDDDPTGPGGSPPVAVVLISPDDIVLAPGDTLTLEVELYASDGSVITGRPVTWLSSSTQFVTVNGSGRVTAVASGGPVLVTATSEGMTGPAFVTVSDGQPQSVVELLDPRP